MNRRHGHTLILLQSGAVQRAIETRLGLGDAYDLARRFQRAHPALGVIIDSSAGELLAYLPPRKPDSRSREPLPLPEPLRPIAEACAVGAGGAK